MAESTAGMLATACPALRYTSFEKGLKAMIVRDADGQMKHVLWSYERRKQGYSLLDNMMWPDIPRYDGSLIEQLAW